MEVALAIFNVGAGLGILAVGVALAYLAWRLTPLIRETRALIADVRSLERDLRPLLDRAREVTHGAEVLTDDAALKVTRLGEMVAALERVTDRMPFATAAPGSPVRSVESSQTPEEWSDR